MELQLLKEEDVKEEDVKEEDVKEEDVKEEYVKEEDVKTEDETSGINVIGHDIEISEITTEHEEILKEITAIMQKYGYQYLPGEDTQGDITKFFVKEDTLMEIILTPNADKEILEMICQGAEQ